MLRGIVASSGEQVLLGFPAHVGKVAPRALRDIFLAAGFRRVLEEGRVVPVEEARLVPEAGVVHVVLDRVTVEPERRARSSSASSRPSRPKYLCSR